MRNWRTIVGALCIVLAMVLGAFAGLVYGRPGGVGASSETGTRGEDRRLVSASDELMNGLSLEEANALVAGDSAATPAAIAGTGQRELVVPGGTAARALSQEEQRSTKEARIAIYVTRDATVTATQEARADTRSGPATGFDAGGPYGGPDVYEGVDITFQLNVYDPAILFFRYDWENDGVFDYPDQEGAGMDGRWTTETTVTWRFNDNVFGEILVEGWDGISRTIEINTGDNLGEADNVGWYIYPANIGTLFTPKTNLEVSELGYYKWYMDYYGFTLRLWEDSTQTLLGECTPTGYDYYMWHWCTLPTPVDLTIGVDYMISEHKDADYYPYWAGIDMPQDPDKIDIQAFYYNWGWDCYDCYPTQFGADYVIPLLDFHWREVLILPDAQQAYAPIEVANAPPEVFGVTTNPDPGLEGSPTEFTAWFEDLGIDDTWEYRWLFHDGDVSDWYPVTKYDGGAKVLFLHTWSDGIGALHTAVAEGCGVFCVRIDEFDFGPLGENRAPTLDEILPYHIVIVGTNYFNSHSEEIGDLLADYMDAGGNVLMMQAGFDTSYGDQAGIAGRWESDGYTPMDRGPAYYWNENLGLIYVPGHPIFDGVASVVGGLRAGSYSTTTGAERIADWTDGTVMVATKENPMVANGAMACALNLFPYQIYGYAGGDWVQLTVNAIRFCSQQPEPVYKPMPMQLDPYQKTYRDDEPTTTTPEDSFPMTVQVRDDDDGKMKIRSKTELYFNDFDDPSQCSGYYWMPSTWPPGWWADPDGYGWTCSYDYTFGDRSPGIWYYYHDFASSYVYAPSVDLSAYQGIAVEFDTYWWADWPYGTSDGYTEVSSDGGATWVQIHGFHHNDPGQYRGPVSAGTTAVGGYSDVMARFRYDSSDDWAWFVDNVRFFGVEGEVMSGLGTAEGLATIANVPPTAAGGFDSALRTESQSLLFKGFEVSDPAILEPTEWFAYAWDFDDGTAVDWTYVGSLAPPKLDVLIVHTLCLSGIGCAEGAPLEDMLLTLDDVGTVDSHNFINYPALPTAPTLATMLQYDVIIIATNWAYYSYPPFDVARRQVGDRAAAYLDAGRGGVLTTMAVYDTSGGNDLFMIRGRYIEEDYGPFEKTDYGFSPQNSLGTIYQPDHDLFVKVTDKVGSMYISGGDYKLTVGGQNNAAGRNGELLADWPSGASAIGVKTLNNDMRTVHFGLFAQPTGADTPMLWRNAIGWASGGIPSPKIQPFTHNWGDNGIYTVDFIAIDDDMGYEWDFGANMPMEVIPGIELSHRYIEVAVDNVEPTIDFGSIEVFIAAEACVRVAGTAGNTVTLDLYTDGFLTSSVSTTRMNGDPNPPTEKCGMVRIDLLSPHTYSMDLTYANPMGGSNPTWIIFAPWREPVTPGHGSVSIKYDFDTAGTISESLDTLKADLFASGHGAKIDFAAEAFDPGTDDLAFFWSWGTEKDAVYDSSAASVYTIHVHHNDGSAQTDGVLESPQYLGFSEPYFDRSANDERTPAGTVDFRVRDTAVHAFQGGQALYYVFLMVLDDDNGRGYPSPFGLDGIDVEVIVVDLR